MTTAFWTSSLGSSECICAALRILLGLREEVAMESNVVLETNGSDAVQSDATVTVPKPGSKERPWNTPNCACENCAATAPHPETGLWPVCDNVAIGI